MKRQIKNLTIKPFRERKGRQGNNKTRRYKLKNEEPVDGNQRRNSTQVDGNIVEQKNGKSNTDKGYGEQM